MAENNALVATPNTSRGINFFDPTSFENAQRACKNFTSSELVPTIYSAAKVGPEKAVANAIIALDMASRIGASPLMVMQNLYVVQGRPAFSSAFLVATINTCGRYDTLKYKMGIDGEAVLKNGQRIPNMYCYAYTWEKGQQYLSEADKAEQKLTSTKITMQMAIDEGWYDKPGSKWKTMPSQMLKYRASAFWCRAFAPELSMGMHTVEEINDGIVTDVDFDENPTTIPNVDAPIEEVAETDGIADKADEIAERNAAKVAAAKAAAEAIRAKKAEAVEAASEDFMSSKGE